MRREHAIHQCLQPVGLFDNDLGVFLQFASNWSAGVPPLVELALEKLRRAAQAAERILDFMSEIADQLAVRLLAGDDALLSRKAQLFADRPQLREQRQPRAIDS